MTKLLATVPEDAEIGSVAVFVGVKRVVSICHPKFVAADSSI
jgi:hypothetical protein